MRNFRGIRFALAAFAALTAAAIAGPASAASGTISIQWVKAGWFIGGQGGSGTLSFGGRRYALGIGGISGGLVFGASQANFSGTVSNIRRASDVAGVYGAVGAGAAIGRTGQGTITLQNEKGALLVLSGYQQGLMVNVDLSGMAISIR